MLQLRFNCLCYECSHLIFCFPRRLTDEFITHQLDTVTIVRIKDSPKNNAEGVNKKESKKKSIKHKLTTNRSVTTDSNYICANSTLGKSEKEVQKVLSSKEIQESKQVEQEDIDPICIYDLYLNSYLFYSRIRSLFLIITSIYREWDNMKKHII